MTNIETPDTDEILRETKKDLVFWREVVEQGLSSKELKKHKRPIVIKWKALYKGFFLFLEVVIREENKHKIKSVSYLKINDTSGTLNTCAYTLLEKEHGEKILDQGDSKLGELEQFLAEKKSRAEKAAEQEYKAAAKAEKGAAKSKTPLAQK